MELIGNAFGLIQFQIVWVGIRKKYKSDHERLNKAFTCVYAHTYMFAALNAMPTLDRLCWSFMLTKKKHSVK